MVCVAFLNGCVDDKKKSKLPPGRQLLLEIPRVYQFSKLGIQQSDGQYVILNIILTNQTNETMEIRVRDFTVRNITDLEEERYSLPVEKRMSTDFGKEFGNDKKTKILERQSLDLHPKIEADRFLIFQVPKTGQLVDYELFYAPLGLAIPLMNSNTESIDRRR
jgi:hypothetical protein